MTPYRLELGRLLGQLAREAQRNGGFCLYLPVEPMHSTPIAASFVVSAGSLGSADIVGLFDAIMSTFSWAGGPVTAAAAASLPQRQR